MVFRSVSVGYRYLLGFSMIWLKEVSGVFQRVPTFEGSRGFRGIFRGREVLGVSGGFKGLQGDYRNVSRGFSGITGCYRRVSMDLECISGHRGSFMGHLRGLSGVIGDLMELQDGFREVSIGFWEFQGVSGFLGRFFLFRFQGCLMRVSGTHGNMRTRLGGT